MTGWQNRLPQRVCTLFRGCQGWQKGDRGRPPLTPPVGGGWLQSKPFGTICPPPYRGSSSRAKWPEVEREGVIGGGGNQKQGVGSCEQNEGNAITWASTLLNSRENLTVRSRHRCARRHLADEFSREFTGNSALWNCNMRNDNPVRLSFYGITACHPSVTPDTLRKGCKPFVAGGFVTLSPFNYFFPI